jgi:hypothetical protein
MSDSAKVKVKSESKSPSAGGGTASSSSRSQKQKSSKQKSKKEKGYSLDKDDIRYLTQNTRYEEKEIRSVLFRFEVSRSLIAVQSCKAGVSNSKRLRGHSWMENGFAGRSFE